MRASPIAYALAFMAIIIIASYVMKPDIIPAIANSIPLYVLAAQICLTLLIIAILLKPKFLDAALSSVSIDSRSLAFLISMTAMCGSLFYQFGMQYTPCELCWFQRIFMYPLPFIIGVSLIRKRDDVFEFAIPLCVVGALIASYHYLIQVFSVSSFACSPDGSCSLVQSMAFGYITIPLMSLTAFISIAALLYLDALSEKRALKDSRP